METGEKYAELECRKKHKPDIGHFATVVTPQRENTDFTATRSVPSRVSLSSLGRGIAIAME